MSSAPGSGRPPSRTHPAHGVRENLGTPLIVFVTVCAHGRKPWLADETVHRLLCQVWLAADAWLVGRYVIMPDHLHLFAAPNPDWNETKGRQPILLDAWVQYWKSQFSKRYKSPGCQWQTDHWDSRLRRSESYSQKWEYVRRNPVRKNLATDVNDWPYQGELNKLQW